MITPHHSFENGIIALANIPIFDLPAGLTIEGQTLYRMQEFHIAFIAAAWLAALANPADTTGETQRIVDAFIDYAAQVDMTRFRPTGEWRLARQGSRMSVLAMVAVDDLEKLYAVFSKTYTINFALPPTYLTLFSFPENTEIELLTSAELERASIPIRIPDLGRIRIGEA